MGGQLGGSFNDELGGGLAHDGSAAGGKLGGAMGSGGGAAGASSTSFRWHCEGKADVVYSRGKKGFSHHGFTPSTGKSIGSGETTTNSYNQSRRCLFRIEQWARVDSWWRVDSYIFFAVYPLKRFKRQGCTCPNTPNATKLPQTNQSYRKLGRYHCRVINAHNASCSTCTLILHGISQHLPNGASPTFLPRPDIATRNTSVSTTRVL